MQYLSNGSARSHSLVPFTAHKNWKAPGTNGGSERMSTEGNHVWKWVMMFRDNFHRQKGDAKGFSYRQILPVHVDGGEE